MRRHSCGHFSFSSTPEPPPRPLSTPDATVYDARHARVETQLKDRDLRPSINSEQECFYDSACSLRGRRGEPRDLSFPGGGFFHRRRRKAALQGARQRLPNKLRYKAPASQEATLPRTQDPTPFSPSFIFRFLAISTRASTHERPFPGATRYTYSAAD